MQHTVDQLKLDLRAAKARELWLRRRVRNLQRKLLDRRKREVAMWRTGTFNRPSTRP